MLMTIKFHRIYTFAAIISFAFIFACFACVHWRRALSQRRLVGKHSHFTVIFNSNEQTVCILTAAKYTPLETKRNRLRYF